LIGDGWLAGWLAGWLETISLWRLFIEKADKPILLYWNILAMEMV